jgi:ABC-2 type transport system ATP-binding protein
VLEDTALIKSKERFPDHVQITLQAGVDSQALLHRLIGAGARINRFEMVEPSLNEIFIESVGKAEARDQRLEGRGQATTF